MEGFSTGRKAGRLGARESFLAALLLSVLCFVACGGGGGGTPTPQNPQPSLTSISPSSANAGDGAFTLTVNGSSFISSSVVRWNGANRTTTFGSATQLTAAIPASDLAAGASVSVTVFNPAPAGGTTDPQTFTINNPAPAITSLNPTSAVAGGAAFNLTVNGSGFVPSSTVRWNGSDRTTTFNSSAQLTAAITAIDIASTGTAQVTVFNSAPAGGASAQTSFTISAVPPLTIETSQLPATTGGREYDFILAVSSGTEPYSWSISAGALPGGLLLNSSTGRISGTVASVGADTPFNFTARVTDASAPTRTGTRGLSIMVRAAGNLGRNNTRAAATAISDGTIAASISPYGDEDFYMFHATAGATVTVEITARRLVPASQLDSAIEIQDSSGARPGNICRSPDRPRDPNTFEEIDPTPTDFDDECVNDDIVLGVSQDSRLEFKPSVTGTYYVRVVDLRGDGRPDLNYELTLSGAD